MGTKSKGQMSNSTVSHLFGSTSSVRTLPPRRVVGPVVGSATRHSRGPVHSYPATNRNAPTHALNLATMPRQLPVQTGYLDIQKLVTLAFNNGESVVACMDPVHGGIMISPSNDLPPRMTFGSQHPILNSLEELGRLARTARPLAARPDVRQNGMWIVPIGDAQSVEASTLSTLDEMLRCANTYPGAMALADGETAVLERLSYFLQSEHTEVSFRASQVIFALCNHANPAVDTALRCTYSLMDALERVAAPQNDAPDCSRQLVLKVLAALRATCAPVPQALEDINVLLAAQRYPGGYPVPGGLLFTQPPILGHNMVLKDENQALRQQNHALRSRLLL